MRFNLILLVIVFSLNTSFSQELKSKSYVLNNSSYLSGYREQVSSYIMRKLYGQPFNKWVDIEREREDLNQNKMWSMNNAAEYMIRSNCPMVLECKPQIFNIAMKCVLSSELDSFAMDYYKFDTYALSKDVGYIIVAYNFNPDPETLSEKTTVLYHENPWCRAFKYLVIQHIFSIIMGEGGEFDKKCLSKDGSQEANLLILGDDKDYLPISKKIAESLFDKWEYKKTMIGSEYFYPAFLFLWNTELDTIAGQYYNEYLQLNEK